MLSWPRPPSILVLNVVFGKLVPNPSCVSNLKLLAATIAEISRGSQILVNAPLAQTPPILVLNVVITVCSKLSYRSN